MYICGNVSGHTFHLDERDFCEFQRRSQEKDEGREKRRELSTKETARAGQQVGRWASGKVKP